VFLVSERFLNIDVFTYIFETQVDTLYSLSIFTVLQESTPKVLESLKNDNSGSRV
jgi:hypothetical protein